MKNKYQIMLGAISFLIGISVILQKIFWTSIIAEIVYYIMVIVSLSIVNSRFVATKLEVIAAYKITSTLWFVGFLIGYSINYLYM